MFVCKWKDRLKQLPCANWHVWSWRSVKLLWLRSNRSVSQLAHALDEVVLLHTLLSFCVFCRVLVGWTISSTIHYCLPAIIDPAAKIYLFCIILAFTLGIFFFNPNRNRDRNSREKIFLEIRQYGWKKKARAMGGHSQLLQRYAIIEKHVQNVIMTDFRYDQEGIGRCS